jgi:hypothetical protein
VEQAKPPAVFQKRLLNSDAYGSSLSSSSLREKAAALSNAMPHKTPFTKLVCENLQEFLFKPYHI